MSGVQQRILMLGATGTIGRATVDALLAHGYDVVCPVRAKGGDRWRSLPEAADLRDCDVTDRAALAGLFERERLDAIVSCLASRTGTSASAWAVDYGVHSHVLKEAQQAGVGQMVLLSAICVQKPLLAFQQAKLAFERELIASGLIYSIVRPTAFFKSLSGQLDRLRRGKPYLLFGDGELTSCKPISDRDVAEYLAGCLDDPARQDRILPIGGPGAAITPREQGELLFQLLDRPARFRHVPLGLLDGIIHFLDLASRVSRRMRDKAEMARIGRYYASESMLVLDARTGRYDAQATPSTGQDLLADHYKRLIRGDISNERGDHAVF
ncbi:NAD(P)H-binding protein [Tabrizicola sp. J26]|uniref:NAD(P)H-binding protein n=1 Tax=Alitabrizicola rongguiensis TaxID=2909234 RepID=UPI001F336788|nr:NAD(P)H-binding protein [Tabrizicola rongguiensis]MCF1710658.1 NAD(P)H-binding protein [Tabrizicola rongguiensis]